VAVRGFDGSPVVQLGKGFATGVSPDGRWVVAETFDRPEVVLLPTGAGAMRALPAPGLRSVSHPRFLPDGRSIVFAGVGADGASRLYVLPLDGGPPRPASDAGVGFGILAVSPDGREVVTRRARDGVPHVYTLAGGSRPLPGAVAGEEALRWSSDGRAVYLSSARELPVRLSRVVVADGRREPIRLLSPSDRAGVRWVSPVALTGDADRIAFSYFRVLSELYEARGLE
jgi:dipeptidyl aminopeptidase/acylaminoacyl peptidase